MINDKILSVSIAAYNVKDTLREALDPFTVDGVREYTDVMIVNDGSKDETPIIAEEYVKKYPDTFRLLNKENGGWGSTLNTGIREAKGKYFKQLDGDDYFSWENLKMFLEKLKDADSDMVYTPFVTYDHGTGGVIRVIGGLVGTYGYFPTGKKIPLNWCSGFLPAMHNLAVRTDILQKNPIDITEHCFYTDVEYILKVINLCSTVIFFDIPVYYYRLARSGQSMSLAGVRKHYKDHQKMLLKMLDYYANKVTDEFKKEVIGTRLLGACRMQYIFYFGLKCTRKQKQELRVFDEILKNEYPEFYHNVEGRPIKLLRKTHFFGYRLIAKLKMKKDKKLKQNIFEGC